jgi:hypothetical protein
MTQHEPSDVVVAPPGAASGSLVSTGRALARPREVRPARFVPITTRNRVLLSVLVFGGIGLAGVLAATLAMPSWFAWIFGGAAGGGLAASLWMGRSRLRRAARRLADPSRRDAALDDLRRLADGPFRVQPAAVDALGHLALDALERAQLQDAIGHARRIAQMSGEPVRRRLPVMGFLGEAAASILGRLFDETRIPLVSGNAFRLSDAGAGEEAAPDLDVLVQALRVLEACDASDPGSVVRAHNELALEDLRGHHPVLAVLVQARASEIAPELAAGLATAVRELPQAERQLVEQRFPSLRSPADATYRELAPEIGEPTSLSIRAAPEALSTLEPSPAPSRWLPVVPRGVRLIGWGYAVMGAFIASMGEGMFMMLAALAFVPMVLGGLYHGRVRVRPLQRAGIESSTRLLELRAMRTRGASQRSDVARLYPFERGELMLVVGLHQAERALEAGDLEEAHDQIAWWLVGADEATLSQLDPVAIAGSAIRVAALLGMHDLAGRMSRTFQPSLKRPRTRTGHGDAPRALALARALVHGTVQRWSEAAAELAIAGEAPPVELDRFEQTLYGTLVRRTRAHEQPIPSALAQLAEAAPAEWIERIWPDT